MALVEESPLRLIHLALSSVEFAIDPEFDRTGAHAAQADIQIHTDFVTERIVEVGVSLRIDWAQEKGPFELKVDYVAKVEVPEDLDREIAIDICRKSLSSIILAQIRPLVSRLTSEAGLNFRLPLLDLRYPPVPAEAGVPENL